MLGAEVERARGTLSVDSSWLADRDRIHRLVLIRLGRQGPVRWELHAIEAQSGGARFSVHAQQRRAAYVVANKKFGRSRGAFRRVWIFWYSRGFWYMRCSHRRRMEEMPGPGVTGEGELPYQEPTILLPRPPRLWQYSEGDDARLAEAHIPNLPADIIRKLWEASKLLVAMILLRFLEYVM